MALGSMSMVHDCPRISDSCFSKSGTFASQLSRTYTCQFSVRTSEYNGEAGGSLLFFRRPRGSLSAGGSLAAMTETMIESTRKGGRRWYLRQSQEGFRVQLESGTVTIIARGAPWTYIYVAPSDQAPKASSTSPCLPLPSSRFLGLS